MAYNEIYPNKIYVHRTIHLGLLSGAEIDITGSDVEYIRKDALLEWFKYKKEWFEGTDIELHYQKMINQLNLM